MAASIASVATAVSGEHYGTNMATNSAATLPSGVTAGDLLIAYVINDTGVDNFTNAGATWTALIGGATGTRDGTTHRYAVYGRIATGSDSLDLTGDNQDFVIGILRIVDHGVKSLASDIIAPAAATGATGNANPPTSGTVASKDWLALASAMVDMTATGDTISAVPSSYTSVYDQKSASSTSSSGLRIASRALTAATSEDPETFTNTSRVWAATTLLIPPAIFEVTDVTVAPTTTGAVISWNTPWFPSSSQLEYGPTASYGSTTTKDTNLVTAHQQEITTGSPGDTIHFRCKSQTSGDAQTAYSSDASFLVPSMEVRSHSVADLGGGSSWNLPKPSGLAVGDLMLTVIMQYTLTTDTWGKPTGWTELCSVAITQTTAVFWKIADSSDVAASTFAFDHGSVGSSQAIGGIIAFIGADSSPFPDGYGTSSSSGDDAGVSASAVYQGPPVIGYSGGMYLLLTAAFAAVSWSDDFYNEGGIEIYDINDGSRAISNFWWYIGSDGSISHKVRCNSGPNGHVISLAINPAPVEAGGSVALAGKAATATEPQANLTMAWAVGGKANAATTPKGLLTVSWALGAKGKAASSAKATLDVSTIEALDTKANIASNAKSAKVDLLREIASKAKTATNAEAPMVEVLRKIDTEANSATKAKATVTAERFVTTKAAAATGSKALLGLGIPVAGKAGTASADKATLGRIIYLEGKG